MEWTDEGVEGASRFLNKVWQLVNSDEYKGIPFQQVKHNNDNDFHIFSCTFKTIKYVTKAIDDFHFNIAIANIRKLFNELNLFETRTDNDKIIKNFVFQIF